MQMLGFSIGTASISWAFVEDGEVKIVSQVLS